MIILSLKPKTKEQAQQWKKEFPTYLQEYRLDLIPDWDWLNEEIIDDNTILTCRERVELGLQERAEFLSKWQQRTNCLADIDLAEWKLLKNNDIFKHERMIISRHFQQKWEWLELRSILAELAASGCRYLKIALEMPDWQSLNALSDLLKETGKEVLVAFLGKQGSSMRCLYRHLGAQGTYAALTGEETASGQPDIELVRTLGLNELCGEELLCGIAGGEQVLHSLGLMHYNQLFREKQIPAVYLPVISEEADDFLGWVHCFRQQEKILGFSITMPLKEQVAKLLNATETPVNFWDGKQQVFNTDADAMRDSLREMSCNSRSRVLVAGSGGSAATAMQVLQEFGCCSEISARNFPRAIRLAKKYKATYVIPENTHLKSYTHFLNTTPLGLNGENVLTMFTCRDFSAAIDLPYNTLETPLAEYCRLKGIAYTSGQEFWQKQASLQENFLLTKAEEKLRRKS